MGISGGGYSGGRRKKEDCVRNLKTFMALFGAVTVLVPARSLLEN